ncbi:MAG: glycosyltransferase [Lachnospiraceae bacterium]|nr:glycosyltransferase [Lachnospiraceae bacterium]
MDEVSVSVIIPVYNVEKYIAECVGSVQNQTLKDIEIICVNDGCSDNTMQIMNTMALEDERIIIVNKMNEGQSSARNTGIKEARGHTCFFLIVMIIYCLRL